VDHPGSDCDIVVVGGGVNGAGIARDAAGRGHKVLLVERGDLAQATSSASSKLIHGGLRYLEYGEVRLVREALAERERLWGMAPHIIWPLRFVIPQTHSPRPAWMLRAGLRLRRWRFITSFGIWLFLALSRARRCKRLCFRHSGMASRFRF
jgi:glycerol-3-phosphate dehydrogenase